MICSAYAKDHDVNWLRAYQHKLLLPQLLSSRRSYTNSHCLSRYGDVLNFCLVSEPLGYSPRFLAVSSDQAGLAPGSRIASAVEVPEMREQRQLSSRAAVWACVRQADTSIPRQL
jgi:hypothetical protein